MQRHQQQLEQARQLLHLGTTLVEGLQGQGEKSCAKSKVSFRCCLLLPAHSHPRPSTSAPCPSSEFNYLGQRTLCRASCQDNATCHLPRLSLRLHCAKMKSELSLLQTQGKRVNRVRKRRVESAGQGCFGLITLSWGHVGRNFCLFYLFHFLQVIPFCA